MLKHNNKHDRHSDEKTDKMDDGVRVVAQDIEKGIKRENAIMLRTINEVLDQIRESKDFYEETGKQTNPSQLNKRVGLLENLKQKVETSDALLLLSSKVSMVVMDILKDEIVSTRYSIISNIEEYLVVPSLSRKKRYLRWKSISIRRRMRLKIV